MHDLPDLRIYFIFIVLFCIMYPLSKAAPVYANRSGFILSMPSFSIRQRHRYKDVSAARMLL